MITPTAYAELAGLKPIALSPGAMREKLAELGIEPTSHLGRHALGGGRLSTRDGQIYQLATSAPSDTKPTQALDADGETIPDVIGADEMRALMQAEGIHLDSNCAKSVLRRGDTYITRQDRHVHVAVAAEGASLAAAKTPAEPLTLLDRVAAIYAGDSLPAEPEPATSAPKTVAVAGDDDPYRAAADAYCGE